MKKVLPANLRELLDAMVQLNIELTRLNVIVQPRKMCLACTSDYAEPNADLCAECAELNRDDWRCFHCDRDIHEEDTHCPECGRERPADEDEDEGEYWVCPICIGSNPPDERACNHCGVSY